MPCVNSPCRHYQPKSNEQRAKHCQEFIDTFRPDFPVLVDTYVDGWVDPFLHTFSAWPERFYIFQYYQEHPSLMEPGWRLRWWNMPHPVEGHRIDDIRGWLEENATRTDGVPPPLTRTTSQVLQEKALTEKVRKIFADLAGEGGLSIGRDNMYVAFERLGYGTETAKAVFEEVDVDHSGHISLEEFEAFYRSIHPRLQLELMKQEDMHHVAGPREVRRFAVTAK